MEAWSIAYFANDFIGCEGSEGVVILSNQNADGLPYPYLEVSSTIDFKTNKARSNSICFGAKQIKRESRVFLWDKKPVQRKRKTQIKFMPAVFFFQNKRNEIKSVIFMLSLE